MHQHKVHPLRGASILFGIGCVVALSQFSFGQGGLIAVHRTEASPPWWSTSQTPLAPLGDLDGDGFAEVVALGRDVMGRSVARAFDPRTGALVATFLGPLAEDGVVDAALGVGDIDRDGVADIAVADAELASVGRRFGSAVHASGVVGVRSGASGALLWTRRPDLRLYSRSGLHYGSRLAAPGDVDGDGAPDLAVAGLGVGARCGPTYGSRIGGHAGRLEMLSGATGVVIWAIDGVRGLDFATDLIAIGDVDGDGVRDLAQIESGRDAGIDSCGPPPWPAIPQVNGGIVLRSGRDGRVIAERRDTTPWQGPQVVWGPDLDRDGLRDLVVFGGRATGTGGFEVFEVALSAASLAPIWGAIRPGGAWGAVAPLPDRDGDGIEDLAVVIASAGVVEVRGRDGVILGALGGAQRPLSSTGRILMAIDDANGDGDRDLIAGAVELLLVVDTGPLISAGSVTGCAPCARRGEQLLLNRVPRHGHEELIFVQTALPPGAPVVLLVGLPVPVPIAVPGACPLILDLTQPWLSLGQTAADALGEARWTQPRSAYPGLTGRALRVQAVELPARPAACWRTLIFGF